MGAIKRLHLLRRITNSPPFRHHTLFPTPPLSSSTPSTSPPHVTSLPNTTSSFIRYFSSSNSPNSNNQDAHFDEFNSSVLTRPDSIITRSDSVLTQHDSVQLGSDALLNGGLVGTGVYDESFLPVRVLISILDSYHNLTGVPWWLVIVSSTVIMRMTLFPTIVLQLRKLKTIGELLPKLPPPFPPPLSGGSITKQFKLFWKEKKAVGCPSFWWFTAGIFTQAPTFFLWITTIRRMSLEQHPGFDCGGTLWLQNLSEYPNGALGPVVPLMIGFLHYVNVQIGFHKSPLSRTKGILARLAKYYKYYLEFLTLPILFAAFSVPQGSLIYWLTNSSLSLVQQLILKDPTVRMKLGLHPVDASPAATSNKELGVSKETENNLIGEKEKEKLVSVEDLSSTELVNGSLVYLSRGNKEKALPLLRLAIQKDPEYGRALVVMGEVLMGDGAHTEALEHFERVATKLSLSGNPLDGEDLYYLILSSQFAGIAHAKLNNYEKAIDHLQRIANLEEPKEPLTKGRYYDGLLLLCSALLNVGKKTEAAQYAHKVAAYDPKFNYLVEEIENDKGGFVNDLANSRRRDY